jgi:hypothetical protein
LKLLSFIEIKILVLSAYIIVTLTLFIDNPKVIWKVKEILCFEFFWTSILLLLIILFVFFCEIWAEKKYRKKFLWKGIKVLLICYFKFHLNFIHDFQLSIIKFIVYEFCILNGIRGYAMKFLKTSVLVTLLFIFHILPFMLTYAKPKKSNVNSKSRGTHSMVNVKLLKSKYL